jgi:hypothetical protein
LGACIQRDFEALIDESAQILRAVTLKELFLGFLKIGLLGFGGVAPWARRDQSSPEPGLAFLQSGRIDRGRMAPIATHPAVDRSRSA